MKDPVKVLFASANDASIAQTLAAFEAIQPELPLIVVSEFRVSQKHEWIPFHIRRRWSENRALFRSRLARREIRLAAMILEPGTPHWPLRFLAMASSGFRLLAFAETGQHFRMRPDNIHVMLRHLWWRSKNLGRVLRKRATLLRDPHERQLLSLCRTARNLPRVATPPADPHPWETRTLKPGISVVIPSRNGRELLATCLPRITDADEIIVVDNGSDDGTAAWLAEN